MAHEDDSMKRAHLFEFIDLGWWPTTLRDLETDALHFALSRAYDEVVPQLQQLLHQTATQQVIDLGSGASGPWPRLLELMAEDRPTVHVKLTDKYPNRSAQQKLSQQPVDQLEYLDQPVDAANVPEELSGVRTMFSGFHHLRPSEAMAVLQDAATRRAAIGVFDGVSARSGIGPLVGMLIMPPLVFFFMLVFSFRIKPVTLSRILFATIIPLIPLAMAWDAAVSMLRVYTQDELKEMTSAVKAQGYRWEIGRTKTNTYLLGYPE